MFYFGVDYYPEQWPQTRWPIDIGLMAEVGFNVVRLADFAWSKLEPQQNCFDFTWLDHVIHLLSERGIQAILATPTASPPPWVMNQDPTLFRVRKDGLRVTYGNRREYCPNHPDYREHTQRIVTAMAEHYAEHPSVIAWQIDNEMGERCYCPNCRQAFQDWLRERYRSLEALNQAWGTIFWSHVYTDWSQIPVPLETGGPPNPGLALDFARFASDSYVGFQKLQVDILRRKCSQHLITHNLMGFDFDQINYFDLVRDLDVVSLNHYPRNQWKFTSEVNPAGIAIQADAMRGLKRQNFWMTEEQVGQAGWDLLSVAPRPGEARLWAYEAIAHGADALLFFRWRSARFGTEQFWQGLLDHSAQPTRRFTEIQKLGAEIARFQHSLEGTQVQARVAFLLSYDTRFAFQIQPNHPRFSYPAHFTEIYAAFHRLNIPIDIVPPDGDFSGYQLVVAPSLYVLSQATTDCLEKFVRAGGVLFLTQRSGMKDEANAVVELPLPGLLAELVGAEVEEADSLAEGMSNTLEYCLPELGSERPKVDRICEVLQTKGAGVVARYTDDFYAGKPAVTDHHYGNGRVVYAGAVGDRSLYDPLAAWLCRLAGVDPLLPAPEGVEVAERRQGENRLIFLLNHTTEHRQVNLDRPYVDLLSAQHTPVDTLVLEPNGCAVLVEEDLSHQY